MDKLHEFGKREVAVRRRMSGCRPCRSQNQQTNEEHPVLGVRPSNRERQEQYQSEAAITKKNASCMGPRHDGDELIPARIEDCDEARRA